MLNQLAAAMAVLLLSAPSALSEIEPEEGRTEVLPSPPGVHWIWALDSGGAHQADTRALLFDGDTGRMLGMVSTGYWNNGPAFSRANSDIIIAETHFERTTRGQRTDVVVKYDAQTLLPRGEVVIPPKRMSALTPQSMSATSDDGRFHIVVNFTPTQSVTIVDLANMTFVEEVDTPGCSSVYASGPRHFSMICGNGTFQTMTLDDNGKVISEETSEEIFDPLEDALTVAAVRHGQDWIFASMDSNAYRVDMSGDTAQLKEKWSLITDKQRHKEWRTSGFQGVAIHTATNRLYTLMHKGPQHTYEEPGKEVWVYDLASHKRIDTIKLAHETLTIEVSRDDNPVLFAGSMRPVMPEILIGIALLFGDIEEIFDIVKPAIDIYDADTGKKLRTIDHVGTFVTKIEQP